MATLSHRFLDLWHRYVRVAEANSQTNSRQRCKIFRVPVCNLLSHIPSKQS
jgi:hypothetical protein